MKSKQTKRIVCLSATILSSVFMSIVPTVAAESTKPEPDALQQPANPTLNASGRSSSGIATWRPIPQIASDISLRGNEEKVKARRGYITLDAPDVYAETLLFENGSLFYKRDRALSDIPAADDNQARLTKINQYIDTVRGKTPILRDVGQFKLTSPSQTQGGSDPLTFASAESGIAYCVGFYKSIDRSAGAGTLAKSATGIFCYPRKSGGSLPDRIDEVAGLANSLAFDGGELAQADSLKGVTKQVHAYWNSKDQKPPEVTLSKADYSENEVFISGKVTDSSKLDFIKVNGERLSDADFSKAMSADGSFSIYAKSSGRSASFTVGDEFGNATTIMQDKFTQVASVNGSGATVITLNPYDKKKTYVLLAGVGAYSDTMLPTLNSPKVDIQRVGEVFKNVVRVPEDQIITLVNPTKNDFLATIKELRTKFRYGDQLMLYYAGHGIIFEETDDGYWSFYDTNGSKPESWLSNREMKNIVSGFSDGGTLLIADSCFSGQFINGRYVSSSNDLSYKDKDSIKAKLAFTSAGRNPVPDTSERMNSAFALSFVEAIQDWSVKARTKKEPDMPAFFVYLDTRMRLDAKNHKLPQYGNFTDDAAKTQDGKVPDFMMQVH